MSVVPVRLCVRFCVRTWVCLCVVTEEGPQDLGTWSDDRRRMVRVRGDGVGRNPRLVCGSESFPGVREGYLDGRYWAFREEVVPTVRPLRQEEDRESLKTGPSPGFGWTRRFASRVMRDGTTELGRCGAGSLDRETSLH